MPTGTNEADDGQPQTDVYDRYSHVKTESGDVIYDTESDNAWIQATCAHHLSEWR